MYESERIPEVTYSPDITDLFENFLFNWHTLAPALWVLYGVLAGFFIAKLIKNKFID